MVSQDWKRVALAMYVVAFGANLFAPMVIVYQHEAELSSVQTTFLFGIYAAGLIGALFVGGPWSDAKGRRAVVRPALVATALGSAILLAGNAGSFPLLLLGRLVIGVAVGLAMSSGAAWIKELSPSVAVGAQRSSIALTLGFATAPFITGLLAQFAPLPTITPFVAHLCLAVGVIALAWTVPGKPPQGGERAWVPRSLFKVRYLPVLTYGPWVFGAATTAFAFLPTLVQDRTDYPVLVAGTIALLTMGTGTLVQRWALNWSPIVAMAAAAVGMGIGLVFVLNLAQPWVLWLLPVEALVMGTAYGTGMVNGLAFTQQLAPPHELGAATGVFYTLTYLGFFAPFILSVLAPLVGLVSAFAFGMAVAVTTMVLLALSPRDFIDHKRG